MSFRHVTGLTSNQLRGSQPRALPSWRSGDTSQLFSTPTPLTDMSESVTDTKLQGVTELQLLYLEKILLLSHFVISWFAYFFLCLVGMYGLVFRFLCDFPTFFLEQKKLLNPLFLFEHICGLLAIIAFQRCEILFFINKWLITVEVYLLLNTTESVHCNNKWVSM